MATSLRRRAAEEPFQIHEDGTDADMEEPTQSQSQEEEEQLEEDEPQEEQDDGSSEASDEDEPIDATVAYDMEKMESTFPAFKNNYRLIKRIGEGTFSTVYKAEDIRYDAYNNYWDLDAKENQWADPSVKPNQSRTRRKPRYVAIKKIYVTSSPHRILNELELLHDLRESTTVCPLITAFRHSDQVLAILPYFRHMDFRDYFRKMTVADMRIYFRSLFSALAAVHERKIIHRDIKPTNFLYDPPTQRGVLVDFGLAEREGTENKPCLCHEDSSVRRQRLRASAGFTSANAGPQTGYPKNDTRPSRRANRAGTRGFRAPEVLFKCTEQTTKIDIWSAGVMLLTILSRRFPFFNSADDVEAMIEISTIFGAKRMKQAGLLHGCVFESSIPTIGQQGFSLEKIILWSTCRTSGGESGKGEPLDEEEKEAVQFLERCLDLDPRKRISAEEAMEHPFLKLPEEELGEQEEEEDVSMI